MLTKQQRAAQFQPFDAMKGLREALRDREERHSRVEKHDISEEAMLRNSQVLTALRKGDRVELKYYCGFHDIEKCAPVTGVSIPFRFLLLGEERVPFDNIYEIRITDHD